MSNEISGYNELGWELTNPHSTTSSTSNESHGEAPNVGGGLWEALKAVAKAPLQHGEKDGESKSAYHEKQSNYCDKGGHALSSMANSPQHIEHWQKMARQGDENAKALLAEYEATSSGTSEGGMNGLTSAQVESGLWLSEP